MTAQSLAAAQAAHPVGKHVAFTVPGRTGGKDGTGRVAGHRDTGKGPFVDIKGDDGRTYSARPAKVRDHHFSADHHSVAGSVADFVS